MGGRVINELAEHKEVKSKCLQRQYWSEVNQFDALAPSLVQKVETPVPWKVRMSVNNNKIVGKSVKGKIGSSHLHSHLSQPGDHPSGEIWTREDTNKGNGDVKCKNENRILNKSLYIKTQEPYQLPSFATLNSSIQFIPSTRGLGDFCLENPTTHSRERSFGYWHMGFIIRKQAGQAPTLGFLNLSIVDILDQIIHFCLFCF